MSSSGNVNKNTITKQLTTKFKVIYLATLLSYLLAMFGTINIIRKQIKQTVASGPKLSKAEDDNKCSKNPTGGNYSGK